MKECGRISNSCCEKEWRVYIIVTLKRAPRIEIDINWNGKIKLTKLTQLLKSHSGFEFTNRVRSRLYRSPLKNIWITD